MTEESLCEQCSYLPRCEVCEVFFDGLVGQSATNPDRCDSCLNFELHIQFNCHICERPIPLYISKGSTVLHYIVRGNACGGCNAGSRATSKISKKDEERHQFIGYLAIIEPMYRAGIISQEDWERAIRRNRHDVTNWDGLDEALMVEEEDVFVSEEIEMEPV